MHHDPSPRPTRLPGRYPLLSHHPRCVRRAFLYGTDHYSGKCFDHRKEWIRERLGYLESIFGIDIAAYAVMSNHCHIVVRLNHPEDLEWTDEDVGERMSWISSFCGCPGFPWISRISIHEAYSVEACLVVCLINSVTLRAPLLGQDKAHSAGNGKPFPRSATQYWHSSGAHYGSAEDYQIYQADH